jgi:prevent-host-death family protein
MYTRLMTKRYSMADARANLPSVVDEVEAGNQIELTRRGKPVAVLISPQEYSRLHSERPTFSEAYRAFRARYPLEDIGLEKDPFAGLRGTAPGRKVNL